MFNLKYAVFWVGCFAAIIGFDLYEAFDEVLPLLLLLLLLLLVVVVVVVVVVVYVVIVVFDAANESERSDPMSLPQSFNA